jgi:hypothetical protein
MASLHKKSIQAIIQQAKGAVDNWPDGAHPSAKMFGLSGQPVGRAWQGEMAVRQCHPFFK